MDSARSGNGLADPPNERTAMYIGVGLGTILLIILLIILL